MSAEAAVSSPDPTMPPPTLPFVTADRSISRPLSEITDNSDKRRSTARSLKGDKGEKTSRPNSEVRDSEPAKRLSSTISLQTITVNLVDYAAVVAKGPTSISSSASAASSLASPIIKPVPVRAEKPVGTSSSLVLTGSVREEKVKEGEAAKKAEAKEDEER